MYWYCSEKIDVDHSWGLQEGLNGVNRQSSKKVIFYRQPSKMKIDISCQTFQGISILLFLVFQLIVIDFWRLKNPAPNKKTSSYVLKNTPSRLYKTLELAYIWNYFKFYVWKAKTTSKTQQIIQIYTEVNI